VKPSAELPLAELLSALAERTPAPGAGSAAAWTGALAAALLEMVAALAGEAGPAKRAPLLRARLLEREEEELRAYQPVLAAKRLAPNDPSRQRRLDEALSQASEPPLAIARAAVEVAELAASVAEQSTPELRGDAIAAVLLAEAASRSALGLVEINLRGRAGNPSLAEVALLGDRAASARDQVLGR
jgi:formiminotetrahydrofolate cyclodeaminase